MAGLYFEEFHVGQTFEHDLKRTVTETDNVLISTLTHNPAAIHLDAESSRDTIFKRRIVNSIYTLGLTIGVSVADTTLGTTIGNLGFDEVRFPRPVFVGDTLRFRTIVHEVRESKSRPDSGIVTFVHQAFNQHDQEVMSCQRAALMLKKPAP